MDASRARVIVGVLVLAAAAGPTVKALDDVFAVNNLEGFAQADALFAQAYRAGDLDAMMAVLRSTLHPSVVCYYPALCEDMIDAALPVAEQRAQWATIGELHLLRYTVNSGLFGAVEIKAVDKRLLRKAEIAAAAYGKAGVHPNPAEGSLTYARQQYLGSTSLERQQADIARLLGPDYGAAFGAIDEAVIYHDDARAVGLCRELLEIIESDPEVSRKLSAARLLARYLWLRGSEPMVPRIIRLADQYAGIALTEKLIDYLVLPWSGQNDVYYDAWRWCARALEQMPSTPNQGFLRAVGFMSKMQRMGRTVEADGLARVWIDWVLRNRRRPRPHRRRHCRGRPGTPIWPSGPIRWPWPTRHAIRRRRRQRRSRAGPTPPIIGRARAFIHAGAQDVVCSLWPVSDESTRAPMTAFYDALAAGAPVEDALQAGQNALPHGGARGDPFYWAGFIALRGPG